MALEIERFQHLFLFRLFVHFSCECLYATIILMNGHYKARLGMRYYVILSLFYIFI